MSQRKTVREHLKRLPLQKRLQAMEATRRLNTSFNVRLNSTCDQNGALTGAFVFDDSKQGHDHWMDLHNKYFRQY